MVVARLAHDTVDVLRKWPEVLERVVWVAEAQEKLRPDVAALLAPHFLERAADTLISFLDPPNPVKWLIRKVWTDPSPATSVKRAAEAKGVGLTTLKDAWASLPFSAELRELVDWGLLGRAVTHRQRGASWSEAAGWLGITEARLERIAARRLRVEPAVIDEMDAAWVEERFAEWFEEALRAGQDE